MGKKKVDDREFNRGLMNFAGDLGGSKEAKELLERYDVEGYRHGRTDRGSTYRGFDEIKKDLSAAMMNDYDTRRSIEAAAMAGNKGAQKFAKKGFTSNANSLVGGWDLMKDLKKEYVGGGGMMDAENRAGLTHALVMADRENQTADYRDEFAPKSALEEMQNKIKQEAIAPEEPYTPSPELEQARAQEEEYNTQLDSFGDVITGSNNDKAQDFKDKYSANVAGGLKLSGIETRGPKSGIRQGEGF